jgi:hypothetical protein
MKTEVECYFGSLVFTGGILQLSVFTSGIVAILSFIYRHIMKTNVISIFYFLNTFNQLPSKHLAKLKKNS